MEIRLKKWFVSGEYTRYKVVLPADNFVECPTKEVYVVGGVQVISREGMYRVTLFGNRQGWLEEVGVIPIALSWKDEVLNTANGISQWSSPWMKKKEVVAVLKKLMPREVASWKDNMLVKPEFSNLVIK